MDIPKKLKVAPNGVVPKVAWVAIRDRAILFARSRGEVLFFNTGGKIKEGETPEQALMREAAEETGAALIPETIKHIHTFEGPCHGYVEGTILRIECFDAKAKGELFPSSEIEEFAWLTSKDKHRTTAMGVQIIDWFYEQGYID